MKSKLLAVRLSYSATGDVEFIKKEIYVRLVEGCNSFWWHRWNYVTAGDEDFYDVINILSRMYDGLHETKLPCIKKVVR